MDFYIPGEGPDESTPEYALNIWSECSIAFAFISAEINQMRLLRHSPILPAFITFTHHAQMLSPLSSLQVLLRVVHALFGINSPMTQTSTLSFLHNQLVHVHSPLI